MTKRNSFSRKCYRIRKRFLNVGLEIVIESCSRKICTKPSKTSKHKYKMKRVATNARNCNARNRRHLEDFSSPDPPPLLLRRAMGSLPSAIAKAIAQISIYPTKSRRVIYDGAPVIIFPRENLNTHCTLYMVVDNGFAYT